MKRVLTITTVNVFKTDESYLEWKNAMISQLSIVDFEKLEKVGNYIIVSGDATDGSESLYTLEVEK